MLGDRRGIDRNEGLCMHIVLRLIANREGSAAIEYAIIAALMSVSAIGALKALAASAIGS